MYVQYKRKPMFLPIVKDHVEQIGHERKTAPSALGYLLVVEDIQKETTDMVPIRL